mgnify:CR=1 FL=1
MSLRTWLIARLVKESDFDWLAEELAGAKDECVASGETTVTWSDQNNRKENISWFFTKNTVTGERSYRFHSYGDAKYFKKHELWIGQAEKYVETGILPDWAEAVDFEMLKK